MSGLLGHRGLVAGGGGPALWTPAHLSTPPSLLFDDESGVTDAGAGACSQWNDRSGNGLHFTQGTSANRPLIVAAGLNGRRTIRFDGTNDMLYTTNATARGLTANQANLSLFVLYKKTALDNSGGPFRFIAGCLGGGGNPRITFYASGSAAGEQNRARFSCRRADGDTGSVAVQPSSRGTDWQMQLGRLEFGTRTGLVDVDGASEFSRSTFTTTGAASSNTSSNVGPSMGGTPGDATSSASTLNAADVEIAGWFLVRSSISQPDVDRIFGYAAHRWGLTSSLDVSHPYRDDPPYL